MKLTANSRVLIQGIAAQHRDTHVRRMLDYGTRIVAGTDPGHGGTFVEGVPVFDMVEQAVSAVGRIDLSAIWVPAYAVLDAGMEAIAAGIRQLVIITEGVPPLDVVQLLREAERTETEIIGPGSPGIIVPGQALAGIHPPDLYRPGSVGICGRCGTLIYEVAATLTQAGIGQSICADIGSETIGGASFIQWIQELDDNEATETIVLVADIASPAEIEVADSIAESIETPVIAYIAGIDLVADRGEAADRPRSGPWLWQSPFGIAPALVERDPSPAIAQSPTPTTPQHGALTVEPSLHGALSAAGIPVAESLSALVALLQAPDN